MGGRGSAGKHSHKKAFSSSGQHVDPNPDSPIRVNSGMHSKHSFESMLGRFDTMHGKDDKEHSVTMNLEGYSVGYSHGVAHSVIPSGDVTGKWIFHNHPSGSQFSSADMKYVAAKKAKGIVALAKGKGAHVFTVTHPRKFYSSDFERAITNASVPSNMSYDEGVSHWLTKNARKFGFRYNFIPASQIEKWK